MIAKFLQYLTVALSLLLWSVMPSMAANPQLHVVALGDSNTWIGGDSCNLDRGWTKWFALNFQPASIRSYARSGATWTHTPATCRDVIGYSERLADNNVVFNQVQRLLLDVRQARCPRPDIIFIAAGTNDVWFRSQRPQVFEQSSEDVFAMPLHDVLSMQMGQITTLPLAVRYNCAVLRKHFPHVHIVLLTPLQTIQADLSEILHAGNLIADCAHRMNCSVIRQDKEGGVQSSREMKSRRYTTDGTHLNVAGARRMGQWIAHCLRARLPLPMR